MCRRSPASSKSLLQVGVWNFDLPVVVHLLTFLPPPAFAGRPFPLQNCSWDRVSLDSVQVECVESYDGGLPQGFLLEVFQVPSLRLVRNLSLLVSLLRFYSRHSRFIPNVGTLAPTRVLLRGWPTARYLLSSPAVCRQPQGALRTGHNRRDPFQGYHKSHRK